MSITYPDVTGTNKIGYDVTIGVGDLVTGRDSFGRLIVGSVIATHPYHPTVTVDGIEVHASGEIRSTRSTVRVDSILTHVRAPRHVGQRVGS